LWENYNKYTEYDVNVFYFDDIYDSEHYRREVNSYGQKVNFYSVPYKTPGFLKDEELFYNRSDIQYAKSFGIRRKGYLHMCNFTSNMFGYENTNLSQYEMIMTHDDESGYNKIMLHDPFVVMKNRSESIGAYSVGKRLKDGAPHQGHLDTRIGLWDLTKKFIADNNVTPANEELRNLLTDDNAETNFHLLDWCDTYVIKTDVFKINLWNTWIKTVNDSGGIYKYRWGDNEIISLFANMIQENIVNLGYVDNGYHNQGKFRHIQDIAPGVKDTSK
tara:strand:- start:10307 stop:11128 length:822 start_codon:yes stop_codon:yes gene_type:complete